MGISTDSMEKLPNTVDDLRITFDMNAVFGVI